MRGRRTFKVPLKILSRGILLLLQVVAVLLVSDSIRDFSRPLQCSDDDVN